MTAIPTRIREFRPEDRDLYSQRHPGRRHGTISMWGTGCRCSDCRTTWNEYQRDRRLATGITKGKRRSVEDRFWAKVIKGERPDSCWEWAGCHNHKGYSHFSLEGGRTVGAHRYSYELVIGPIPEGLQLDHLCRNRGCVNPAHLEPVTNQENSRRGDVGGWQRRLTHCKHGHPFTPENTFVPKSSARRVCKVCERLRHRRRRQRQREVVSS